MRALVLDELNPREMTAVRDYLATRARLSGVIGLYWLELPRALWAAPQREAHGRGAEGANSFNLAVEAGPTWARFELLVRSETVANTGGGQATDEQALFVLGWAGAMARELGLASCADYAGPAGKEGACL